MTKPLEQAIETARALPSPHRPVKLRHTPRAARDLAEIAEFLHVRNPAQCWDILTI